MPMGLEDTEKNAGLRNNNQEHEVSDVTKVVLFTHKLMRFDASFLLSYLMFLIAMPQVPCNQEPQETGLQASEEESCSECRKVHHK